MQICKFDAPDDDAYEQVEGNIIDLVRWAEHPATPIAPPLLPLRLPPPQPAAVTSPPALPSEVQLRRRGPSFADLSATPRYLAEVVAPEVTASAAYWRRLTLASYNIYEALYATCCDEQRGTVNCKAHLTYYPIRHSPCPAVARRRRYPSPRLLLLPSMPGVFFFFLRPYPQARLGYGLADS